MKQYTYEELCALVEQWLAENQNVYYYRSRNRPSKAVHRFIKLNEPICYEPHWRGGPLNFKKGDYLHADPRDIYGLTAETLTRCYVPTEMPI